MGKHGFGHLYLRGRIWWMKYYDAGVPYRESTKREQRTAAAKVLLQRLAAIDTGTFAVQNRQTKIKISRLLDDLLLDYKINRPNSLKDFAEPIVRAHLRPHFGELPARALTTERLKAYQGKRLAAEISNATVNRELSLLRRAFNLGKQATPPLVTTIPHFPMLPENNVRRGFLEDDRYRAVLRELPREIQPLLVIGYHTGCRSGELLSLQWEQVDLRARRIMFYRVISVF